MFACQNVLNVALQRFKKVMFVNMGHIPCMAQLALSATLTIITQKVKLSTLSKMVQVLVMFLMLKVNARQ